MKVVESVEKGKKKKKLRQIIGLKKVQKLGRGFEGIAYRAVAYLKGKRGQNTKMPVKVKEFDLLVFGKSGTWGDPQEQLRQIRKLIRLNYKKKLGLRIVSRIALVKHHPEKLALVTEYLPHANLSSKQLLQFERDVLRQQKILKKHGFDYNPDLFFPQIDPHTNRGIAVINDFGHLKGPRLPFSPTSKLGKQALDVLEKIKKFFFKNR